jgi:F-type H+-transporting ATPase subunit gamma
MAWAKEIKRKITSIKNTGKITKAMELISTVKMKKAQDVALAKKEFILEILKVFLRIREELSDFPLFQEQIGEKTLWVVITSNKGLCWGYNVNVFKKVNTYMKENQESIDFISLGKKAARFVAKTGNHLIADFSDIYTDSFEPIFIKNISKTIREEFLTGKYKKVVVFYTHYINTIKQVAIDWEFLPIDEKDIESYLVRVAGQFFDVNAETGHLDNLFWYDIEPSVSEIANEVIPMILDMMFYDIILEAKASEHSSRMIAMKNAKDNAKKIAGALTLKYNKARQSMITKEVSEITAGVESLKD